MFDEWKKLRNCVQTYSPVCTAQRNLNILKLTTRLWVAALASTNMYPLLPLDGGESWEDHIRNTIIHEALENPALEGLRVCQLKHPIGFTLWAAMVSISDLKVLVGIAFYCWIGEWKMRFQVAAIILPALLTVIQLIVWILPTHSLQCLVPTRGTKLCVYILKVADYHEFLLHLFTMSWSRKSEPHESSSWGNWISQCFQHCRKNSSISTMSNTLLGEGALTAPSELLPVQEQTFHSDLQGQAYHAFSGVKQFLGTAQMELSILRFRFSSRGSCVVSISRFL